MRKLLMIVAVFFAMATVSRANPSSCVTGTLSSFVSLGTTGCSINGNVVADVATNLSSTLQGDVTLTPITSGSGAGGFTASLDLTALANTSSTLSFTLAAPAGFNLTDLSVGITGGAAGAVSLNLTAANGLNVTATSGGGVMNPTFSGVGSLNLTGTLSVAANATGTATLTITPSLTSLSATPEPPALSLFAIGLLGLGLVCGRRMLARCG